MFPSHPFICRARAIQIITKPGMAIDFLAHDGIINDTDDVNNVQGGLQCQHRSPPGDSR